MLFTITKNNFSDSDDNKFKLKKIKKDAIQIKRPFSGFDSKYLIIFPNFINFLNC